MGLAAEVSSQIDYASNEVANKVGITQADAKKALYLFSDNSKNPETALRDMALNLSPEKVDLIKQTMGELNQQGKFGVETLTELTKGSATNSATMGNLISEARKEASQRIQSATSANFQRSTSQGGAVSSGGSAKDQAASLQAAMSNIGGMGAPSMRRNQAVNAGGKLQDISGNRLPKAIDDMKHFLNGKIKLAPNDKAAQKFIDQLKVITDYEAALGEHANDARVVAFNEMVAKARGISVEQLQEEQAKETTATAPTQSAEMGVVPSQQDIDNLKQTVSSLRQQALKTSDIELQNELLAEADSLVAEIAEFEAELNKGFTHEAVESVEPVEQKIDPRIEQAKTEQQAALHQVGAIVMKAANSLQHIKSLGVDISGIGIDITNPMESDLNPLVSAMEQFAINPATADHVRDELVDLMHEFDQADKHREIVRQRAAEIELRSPDTVAPAPTATPQQAQPAPQPTATIEPTITASTPEPSVEPAPQATVEAFTPEPYQITEQDTRRLNRLQEVNARLEELTDTKKSFFSKKTDPREIENLKYERTSLLEKLPPEAISEYEAATAPKQQPQPTADIEIRATELNAQIAAEKDPAKRATLEAQREEMSPQLRAHRMRDHTIDRLANEAKEQGVPIAEVLATEITEREQGQNIELPADLAESVETLRQQLGDDVDRR